MTTTVPTTEHTAERIRAGDRRYRVHHCTVVVDGKRCDLPTDVCGECGQPFDPEDGLTHWGKRHLCRSCLNREWHTPKLEDYLFQTSAFGRLSDQADGHNGGDDLRRRMNTKHLRSKGIKLPAPIEWRRSQKR